MPVYGEQEVSARSLLDPTCNITASFLNIKTGHRVASILGEAIENIDLEVPSMLGEVEMYLVVLAGVFIRHRELLVAPLDVLPGEAEVGNMAEEEV